MTVFSLDRARGSDAASIAPKENPAQVVHPETAESIAEDLAVLGALAEAVDAVLPSLARFLDPVGLVADFGDKMGRSASMEAEFAALGALRRNFEAVDGVVVPEPIVAKRGALVESFEAGVPLAACLRALDASDAPEATKRGARRAIARRGLRALLKMLFVDNLVHCDMHSGNLLVRPRDGDDHHGGGDDPWARVAAGAFDLVVLDAGLVLRLADDDLVNFVDLFSAVVKRDGRTCGHLLLDRARYHECGDRDAFARDVAALLARATSPAAGGLAGVRLRDLDVGALLFDVLDVCRRHKVRLEAKFATTVVAITIVEGIGKTLDPDLDLLAEAAPFLLSRAARTAAAGLSSS